MSETETHDTTTGERRSPGGSVSAPIDPDARADAAERYLRAAEAEAEEAADTSAAVEAEADTEVAPSPADVRSAEQSLTSIATVVFEAVALAAGRRRPDSAARIAEAGRTRAPQIARRLAPRVAHVRGLWWAGVLADVIEPFLADRIAALTEHAR